MIHYEIPVLIPPKEMIQPRCFFCSFRWFFGKLSRVEALNHLMSAENDNGSFLVRISEIESMAFVLSGVCCVCVCVCVVFWQPLGSLLLHTLESLKAIISDWSSGSCLLVKSQANVKHFKIYNTCAQFYVDPSPQFASVLEVVQYYQTYPLSTSDLLRKPCIRVRLFLLPFRHFSPLLCLFLQCISLVLLLSFSLVKWGNAWKSVVIVIRMST